MRLFCISFLHSRILCVSQLFAFGQNSMALNILHNSSFIVVKLIRSMHRIRCFKQFRKRDTIQQHCIDSIQLVYNFLFSIQSPNITRIFSNLIDPMNKMFIFFFFGWNCSAEKVASLFGPNIATESYCSSRISTTFASFDHFWIDLRISVSPARSTFIRVHSRVCVLCGDIASQYRAIIFYC